MSKIKSLEIYIDIEEIIERKILIEFNRKPLDKSMLLGFVLACNDEFTLIHKFDRDLFVLDGYCIFQNDSVKKYAVYDDENYFLNEVIRLKKIKPKPIPDISIKSWPDIIQTVNDNFPLIRIEQEKIHKNECNIGKLEKLKKKSFSLKEVDTSADWYGRPYSYKFKDLTIVGFDGPYENTLALVAENRENSNSKEI